MAFLTRRETIPNSMPTYAPPSGSYSSSSYQSMPGTAYQGGAAPLYSTSNYQVPTSFAENNAYINSYPRSQLTGSQYSPGSTYSGQVAVTNPQQNYPAYQQESRLESSFGILGGYVGPMIRYLATQGVQSNRMWNSGTGRDFENGGLGAIPGYNPVGDANTLTFGFGSEGNLRGTGNIFIDPDLPQKQATEGTPEWARKILSDMTPDVPGSYADVFTNTYTSQKDRINARTGGTDISRSGTVNYDQFGMAYTPKVSPVDFTSDRAGNVYKTLSENVNITGSGYGIPYLRAGERLAPLSVSQGTGEFYGPQYSIGAASLNDRAYAQVSSGVGNIKFAQVGAWQSSSLSYPKTSTTSSYSYSSGWRK